MPKAILLLSGGLDSTLAGKLLLDMGIQIEALNFVSPFCRCTPKGLGCPAARKAAEQLGIPVQILACGEEYLQVVKHPRFGRGRGMNPCLDCRIHMFSQARRRMEETGADFIATGEVLGERPMSQRRHAMEIIERESGLAGLIVRPLSSKLLPESLPEEKGLLDTARLKAIQGRSRKPQIALANKLGIRDYLCPAGGCLLTDREFSVRLRDLFDYDPSCKMSDIGLLKLGRHFRLDSGAKVVVGRNEEENAVLESLVRPDDALLIPQNSPGPTALCRGPSPTDDVPLAARLLVAHAKRGTTRLDVAVRGPDSSAQLLPGVRGLTRVDASRWIVSASPLCPAGK